MLLQLPTLESLAQGCFGFHSFGHPQPQIPRGPQPQPFKHLQCLGSATANFNPMEAVPLLGGVNLACLYIASSCSVGRERKSGVGD